MRRLLGGLRSSKTAGEDDEAASVVGSEFASDRSRAMMTPSDSYQFAIEHYRSTVDVTPKIVESNNSNYVVSSAAGVAAAPPIHAPPRANRSTAYVPPPPPPPRQPTPARRTPNAPPTYTTNHSPLPSYSSVEQPPVPEIAANRSACSELDENDSTASNNSQPSSCHRPIYEPEMPDLTYEEHYGDAYVGGPIKYLYPSGYQSMRPRGGPWKMSIIVCTLFTWLTIFIVGHCSDRVDLNVNGNEIDDDVLLIETRWCGSRLLYFMWVISVCITGLAAAYCSIIGYIKVRDFALANGRSQPPGMVGKSDYYVRIEEDTTRTWGDGGDKLAAAQIYQADGTPRFLGSRIYRPTQAAVAVTSR